MLKKIAIIDTCFGEFFFEQEKKCESDQVLSEDSNKDILLQTEVGRKQERRQPSDEGDRQIKKQNTSEGEAEAKLYEQKYVEIQSELAKIKKKIEDLDYWCRVMAKLHPHLVPPSQTNQQNQPNTSHLGVNNDFEI